MKGFSFKGLVDLAQEAWNLATASVKKSGDTMTGDLILKPGTATPLTLGRGSQVSLRYEYAADAYKYLGVSTDGTIRYSNTPDLALDGQKIYHQGFKPTAADVGAVAKTGDTMTGELNMNGNKIFMDNANIDGLNCLTFSDAATNQSEGIRWPTTDGSTTYDGIHAAGGSLYFNGTNKVYHQGFKPTPADIGAAAASHTHTAADVGASPAGHTHTAADVGAVSKGGDTVTGNLRINTPTAPEISFTKEGTLYAGAVGIRDDGHFFAYHSDYGEFLQFRNGETQSHNPTTLSPQGTAANSLTRKDYVDNKTWTAAKGNSDIVSGAHDVVGAYGFLKLAVEHGQDVSVGETYPGSSLGYASGAGSGYSGVPSGTWKCMGYIHTSADDSHDDVTLWVRVA